METPNDILETGRDFPKILASGDYRKAQERAREVIHECKQWLRCTEASRADDVLDAVIHIAVFFRALYDYAGLKELTSKDDWYDNHDTVEAVWDKLWDCRDRLDFASSRVRGPVIASVFSNLRALQEAYSEQFGEGLYASPEILMTHEKCSLCGEDLRRCPHLPGRVYGGRICSSLPQVLSLESVSIVAAPRDPRCRIWPWQFDGEKIVGMKLLSVFAIDDFMNNDAWEKVDDASAGG